MGKSFPGGRMCKLLFGAERTPLTGGAKTEMWSLDILGYNWEIPGGGCQGDSRDTGKLDGDL